MLNLVRGRSVTMIVERLGGKEAALPRPDGDRFLPLSIRGFGLTSVSSSFSAEEGFIDAEKLSFVVFVSWSFEALSLFGSARAGFSVLC